MQLGRLTNRLAFTTTLLVLANFAPLVGVLFFDWSMYQVVLLFWAENLVIGFFSMAREPLKN